MTKVLTENSIDKSIFSFVYPPWTKALKIYYETWIYLSKDLYLGERGGEGEFPNIYFYLNFFKWSDKDGKEYLIS